MIALDLGLWRGQASFNPLSFSPLAWWDWSDGSQIYTDSSLTTLVSADGDPIGGIKDKSGSNYHLTQTDPTKKGLYKTSILNGKSVGRTDGVNDHWFVASSNGYFKSIYYGGATVFLAVKAGVVASPNALYVVLGNNANSGNPGFFIGMENRTGSMTKAVRTLIYSSSAIVADSASEPTNYANSFPPNTASIVTIKTDPQNATAANRLITKLNNGSEIKGNNETGSASNVNANAVLSVASNANAAGSFNFFTPGDFCEILIYPTILNETNADLVRAYLNSKWGIY